MSILMKYPTMDGDELWDGFLHNIQPIELFYLNGHEFYLLNYNDEKFKRECATILKKEGNGFIKIPLKNYGSLWEKIESGDIKLEPANLSILDNVKVIFNDQPINVEELFPNQNYTKFPNRREQVNNAIELFLDAIRWRHGIYELPELVKNAILALNNLNIDSLTQNIFNLFIKELHDSLNECISENDGIVLLGPAEVDISRGVNVIYRLIDKYFKNLYKPQVNSLGIESSLPAAATAAGPPPPYYHYDPKYPNYLPEKFNYIYRAPEPPRHGFFEERKKQLKYEYYISLDNDFYKSDKIFNYPSFIFEGKNYENCENIEKELYFEYDLDCYRPILNEYLKKVKKGEFRLVTPLLITLDLKNKCYYYGFNDEIEEPTFVYYNFANCDIKEKNDEIFGKEICITIPENCPYRHISRRSFIAATFRFGVEGGYTLSSYYKTFEGDLSKISYWPFDVLENLGKQK